MKKLCLISLLFISVFSFGQSSVTHSAGVGEELPSPACKSCPGTDWNYPENITMEDGSVTTTGLNVYGNCFMSTCFYSRFLYAHDFNFGIPNDVTIDSIFVDIKRAAADANTVRDSIVQLQKRDSLIGDNLKSSTRWPIALTYESYGHDNPLWGSTWLPADINDSTFGVSIKVMNLSDAQEEANVDHVQMTIYFSNATGTYSVTSSPTAIEWINSSNEMAVNFYSSTSVTCSSKIYTISGQMVKEYHYGQSFIGQNHLQCSFENLTEGIYFVQWQIGWKSFARKMVIMKE